MHVVYYRNTQALLTPGIVVSIGRAPENDVLLPEATVSRRHAVILLKGDQPVLEDRHSTNGTRVNGETIKRVELRDGDTIAIGSFRLMYRSFLSAGEKAEFEAALPDTIMIEQRIEDLVGAIRPGETDAVYGFKHFINAVRDKLNVRANVDRLTGLQNRRSFDEHFPFEFERARRYRHSMCLIMIDVDHFKTVNDTHGHAKGDDVLRSVATVILESVRVTDYCARYGGEEMVVLLPEISLENAALVAEKIRRNVQERSEELAGVPVTISLGVSTLVKNFESPSALLTAADARLYEAKKSGRNRVVIDE